MCLRVFESRLISFRILITTHFMESCDLLERDCANRGSTFRGRLEPSPLDWAARTPDICLLALAARCSRSRRQRGWSPVRAVKESLAPAPLQAAGGGRQSWASLARRGITSGSAPIPTWRSPWASVSAHRVLVIGTLVTWGQRPSLLQDGHPH